MCICSLFFYSHGHPRDLHSFPTRRSSDLPHTPGTRQSPSREITGIQAVVQHRRSEEDSIDRLPSYFPDRKSTRLNSSHLGISYAVFCLKKKRNDGRDPRSKAHIT